MMKLKLVVLIFWSVTALSQKPKVEIVIDSINYKDSLKERIFTVNYKITNISNENVSFFLNPSRIIPNSAASMRYNPYYRIFQNSKMENFPMKFTSNRGTDKKKDKYLEFLLNHTKYVDSVFTDYKIKGGTSEDKYWVAKKTELLNSIMILGAKETKTFSFDFYWDKTKYYREGDMEYIIDEKDVFEMDLTINLMKKDFKSWLSTEEYSKIALDKNFVEGVFTSNKMILNLN